MSPHLEENDKEQTSRSERERTVAEEREVTEGGATTSKLKVPLAPPASRASKPSKACPARASVCLPIPQKQNYTPCLAAPAPRYEKEESGSGRWTCIVNRIVSGLDSSQGPHSTSSPPWPPSSMRGVCGGGGGLEYIRQDQSMTLTSQ